MRPRAVLALGLMCAAAPLAGQMPSPAAVTHPQDTVLTNAAQWPLRVQTTGPTRVTVLLAPVAPDAGPLRVESLTVHADSTLWPLRAIAGTPLQSGIYRLEWVSEDSASGEKTLRVRVLALERSQADTAPHPPALDRSAFLPETTRARSHRPGYLLIAGIGVATLATAATFEDGSVSPITIAIPTALALGGLFGFVKGKTVAEVNQDNVAHNRQLVTADLTARRSIASANARAREQASLRIRVVDR